MNPKHIRHREYPPIRIGISSSCGCRTTDMRPAGCGGDLNQVAIHGIHDDIWVQEMRRRYPESLVFRAWNDPEFLSEQEMRQAVSITGDAEIALQWARSNE